MAGSVPRGIRKRTNSAGQARYQVRYLVRDPDSLSGWVGTSSTFSTLREARPFKADRDGESGNRRQALRPPSWPSQTLGNLDPIQCVEAPGRLTQDVERLHPALGATDQSILRPCPGRRDRCATTYNDSSTSLPSDHGPNSPRSGSWARFSTWRAKTAEYTPTRCPWCVVSAHPQGQPHDRLPDGRCSVSTLALLLSRRLAYHD